jgi:hypothetical protein
MRAFVITKAQLSGKSTTVIRISNLKMCLAWITDHLAVRPFPSSAQVLRQLGDPLVLSHTHYSEVELMAPFNFLHSGLFFF